MQLQKVWEQMHLSYERKARQIWVVNVGDLKPLVRMHTLCHQQLSSVLTSRGILGSPNWLLSGPRL